MDGVLEIARKYFMRQINDTEKHIDTIDSGEYQIGFYQRYDGTEYVLVCSKGTLQFYERWANPTFWDLLE